jgi:hypothetical protein
MKITKDMVMKGAKILVPIVGLAVTAATNYFAEKDLDEKITKGVAEKLAEMNKKES